MASVESELTSRIDEVTTLTAKLRATQRDTAGLQDEMDGLRAALARDAAEKAEALSRAKLLEEQASINSARRRDCDMRLRGACPCR
jgi:chromosome segregation ATPase